MIDKWQVLKEELSIRVQQKGPSKEQEVLMGVLELMQDIDTIEITNKTHGHENG